MKIELDDQSPVQKKMTVEVGPEMVARETEEVLRAYARKAQLPGFRPGKAPLSVIRSRFAKEVGEEVRDRMVSRCFQEAAREKELVPLGEPILEDVSIDEQDGLRFKTRFEVMPRLELRNHKGVEVRRGTAEVTDDDVRKALDELRESQAKLILDEEREASTGDVLVADVHGTPEGGEPFERERMFIEVGAPDNLPAFNERVEGARAGADLEFSVEYPKEYAAEPLAGKQVAYRVHVHEVKRREIPELDDEFAKDLGDFGSLDDLRQRIQEDLQKRKKLEVERSVRQAVLDKVLIENPVPLPETLVEGEIRYRLEELVRRLMMQGMDPEKVDLDWKQLREQQAEPARKSVHARLVLDALARDEGLAVDVGEVEERLRRDSEAMGQSYEKFRADVEKQGGVEVLKSQLLREKSLDLLTAVANIQDEE